MLRTLGVFFLAVLLAAGAAFGFWKYEDQQARAFVSRAIPVIFKSWDQRTLDTLVVRELQYSNFKEESRQTLTMFGNVLGAFESMEEPEGTLQFGKPDRSMPRALFGRYETPAKFQHGEGSIQITVVKQSGAWRIIRWAVSSPEAWQMMQKPGLQSDGSVELHAGPAKTEQEVLKRTIEVLQLLDDDAPGSCWDGAAPSFQEKISRSDFVTKMREKSRALQLKVGEAPERRLGRAGFAENLPGAPRGEFAVLEFASNYPRYQLDERVILIRRDDRWLLAGYTWHGH